MRRLCDVSFIGGSTVVIMPKTCSEDRTNSLRRYISFSFSSRSAEIVHEFEGLEYHGGPCMVFKETVVLESVS